MSPDPAFTVYELARTKWYAAFHVTVPVSATLLILADPVETNGVTAAVPSLLNAVLAVSVAVRYAA